MEPDDLFLVNSTSGTTGLPKVVMHTQNRWRYFHQVVVRHGDLGATNVFLAAIPAPFGFGIWNCALVTDPASARRVSFRPTSPPSARPRSSSSIR